MGNVDTTKREVEEHEAKDNPHGDSASTSDLSSHESDESNPHNVTDEQTGAADALSSHADAGNPHSDSASQADLYSDSDAQQQALAYRLLGGI